ncbi:MAG: exodeoxyribonuclease VII large subunit [Anaerolineae bacterium]|jgi:exodeoxyribonuclease VII large subunit
MDTWTVSELTRYIKELLDSAPGLADLWVAGELSNWSRARSGHCYFTLKDDQAEIPCVMWRGAADRLTFEPRVGDWVQALGSVSVYERGGKYQFYATALQRAGVGVLWERFLALKNRLEQEGLFDESRKRPLPSWPRRIGVVTSPTGAALRDILNVLNERYPVVEVVLSPSVVQGPEAPAGLVAALERLYDDPGIDLIILARGGGSMEDLWCFNDEILARTIVQAPVPVISGVGHETDYTIADLAADYRAPTPSAAAAAAVPDAATLLEQIALKGQRARSAIDAIIGQAHDDLERANRRLLLQSPERRLPELWQQLDDVTRDLTRAAAHQLDLSRVQVEGARARLTALDPSLVLKRGYAALEDAATGQRITRVSQTAVGKRLGVRLYDGRLQADVVEIDHASIDDHESSKRN